MNRLISGMILLALSLSSPIIQAGGDAAAGAEKVKTKGCIACHGPDGNSPSPSDQPIQPPVLAGQHADYMVHALKDYASGARQSPFMAGFAATLDAQDREDIAAFYASQKSSLKTIKFKH